MTDSSCDENLDEKVEDKLFEEPDDQKNQEEYSIVPSANKSFQNKGYIFDKSAISIFDLYKLKNLPINRMNSILKKKQLYSRTSKSIDKNGL